KRRRGSCLSPRSAGHSPYRKGRGACLRDRERLDLTRGQTPITRLLFPLPEGTGIELNELRQDRSADFSPLPAVLAGPERGGLKSALLNSIAVGTGRGAFNKNGLLSPSLSFCGERENMSSGQAVVVSRSAPTDRISPIML